MCFFYLFNKLLNKFEEIVFILCFVYYLFIFLKIKWKFKKKILKNLVYKDNYLVWGEIDLFIGRGCWRMVVVGYVILYVCCWVIRWMGVIIER